jgi:hypothetical protein
MMTSDTFLNPEADRPCYLSVLPKGSRMQWPEIFELGGTKRISHNDMHKHAYVLNKVQYEAIVAVKGPPKAAEEKIPIDPQTFDRAREFDLDPTVCTLSGGEDYELLVSILNQYGARSCYDDNHVRENSYNYSPVVTDIDEQLEQLRRDAEEDEEDNMQNTINTTGGRHRRKLTKFRKHKKTHKKPNKKNKRSTKRRKHTKK